MEESAQRRERLKAMRIEASQAANNVEHSTVSHGLSNPLIETGATNQGVMELRAPQRFDYYTDPMSAFSGNKRWSKVSPQISQDYSTPPRTWNPEMIPSPALQPHVNYSSDQRMHQPQGHYGNRVGMSSPGGVWNGSGGTSYYSFPSNSPRGGNFHSPGFVQGGSPSFISGQGRGHWFSSSPRPGSQLGGGPGFGQGGSPRLNSGQGRGPWFSNSPGPGSGPGGYPGFGQGSSPSSNSGQGRGNLFSNSPRPGSNSGRGRGRWSGQSGGRGRGSHNHVTAEDRPDLYYNKSMVEDPWMFVIPVVWKSSAQSLNTPDSYKSWLPKSVGMKRAKVSEASGQSSSQPSLAEYLAASFNEAVNDEPNG